MIEAPYPGIYTNVPFATYLEWPAISNSSLNAASRSMAHYRHQEPVEETPAMAFGTLCHAGRLEPLEIPKRYVVMPAYEDQVRKPNGDVYEKPRATAAYRELVADFKKANADKVCVTQREYDDMLGVVKSLSLCERANGYFAGCEYEVAALWRDEATGLLCKGRMDAMSRCKRRIVDLKTTNDASQFESTIAKRGYHRQLAFYADGLRTLGVSVDEHVIVAVETERPVFGVRAKPLSQASIESGRKQYRKLLGQIAQCSKTGEWPGYDTDGEWVLPAWAVRDCDDDGERVTLKIGGKLVEV